MILIAIWWTMLVVGGSMCHEQQVSRDFERAHPAQYARRR